MNPENWQQIIITTKSTLRNISKHPEDYQQNLERKNFIRSNLPTTIKSLKIEEYHILNYLETDPNTGLNKGYMRFRFLADKEKTNQLTDYLQRMQDEKKKIDAFSEPFPYDLHKDAYDRFGVESLQKKFSQIFDDPNLNVKRFEMMLSRTVKNCVEKFIEDFQEPPRDIWLMSVFLHLFLNSLGFNHFQEKAIRGFPYM